MARNLTDPVDGCLRRARYLIHDRDPLSTRGFGEILEGRGCPADPAPAEESQSHRLCRAVRPLNQRGVSQSRRPLGEGHVRLLVGEYVDHSHRERNHQGLDNQLHPLGPPPPVSQAADSRRAGGLGGLLNFYHWRPHERSAD